MLWLFFGCCRDVSHTEIPAWALLDRACLVSTAFF
jgi:hypothetical protein